MEKSIVCTAEEVRGFLEGRKTQIRRVIKPQPDHFHRDIIGKPKPYKQEDWDRLLPQIGDKEIKLPWQAGDVLRVRETWAPVNSEAGPGFTYKADHNMKFCSDDAFPVEYERYPGCDFSMWCGDLWRGEPEHHWRSSIHMPKFAARLFLPVQSVRVEKLQDITNFDIYAEGCPKCIGLSECGGGCESCPSDHPREWFKNYWDATNAKKGYPFESNPWVIVTEVNNAN